MNEVTEKKWRSLIHVIYVSKHERDGFWARIPAWESEVAVQIRWDQVQIDIRPYIKVDARLHGLVCLGAEHWSDLNVYMNEFPQEAQTPQSSIIDRLRLAIRGYQIKRQR
jgi:hypothetical protein